jgi:putative membrane protein
MKKYILSVIILCLVITGYFANDTFTWFLETIWVMVGILIIAILYKKPITPLLGTLLFIHALILIM